MRRLGVGLALAFVMLTALPVWAGPLLGQGEQPRVDVGEVWPFWVTLSGLVLAIGTLTLWDTRRRRRGPRG